MGWVHVLRQPPAGTTHVQDNQAIYTVTSITFLVRRAECPSLPMMAEDGIREPYGTG